MTNPPANESMTNNPASRKTTGRDSRPSPNRGEIGAGPSARTHSTSGPSREKRTVRITPTTAYANTIDRYPTIGAVPAQRTPSETPPASSTPSAPLNDPARFAQANTLAR